MQKIKGQRGKDFSDTAYEMTLSIEKRLGKNNQEAKEIAEKIRIKMKKRLKILSLPEEAA